MAAIPKVVVDGAIQETLRGDSERQLLAQETAETCRSDWSHWSVLEDASLVHARRNLERLSSGRAPMGKFINAPEGCRHGTHTSKHARTAPSVRPSVPLSVAVRQTDRRQPQKSK